MTDNKRQVKDHLSRVPGTALQSLPGFTLWWLGRGLDAPFQYLMFSRGWAVKALSFVGLHGSNTVLRAGPGAGGLGSVPTLLTVLYAAAAVRQVYWITFTNTYEWPIAQACAVVLYILFVDTFNTLNAVRTLTSSSPVLTGSFVDALGWKQWIGIGLFVLGNFIETLSEESRKRFKANPANKGKIDDTGLWSVVRHPNYVGYTLWRSGITLSTGAIGATLAFGIFQIAVFSFQSIPGLSGHMSQRYGEQWTAYEKRVPYKLIPGIL
jgi:protein-S-isoprenylcysteine O-methyltransferase Ste14